MALVKAKKKVDIKETNVIAEKIQQRRLQILVHSCIYYRLGDSIITDTQWDKWARELVTLQQQNPTIASTVLYAEEFNNFDGSSGYDLPMGIPYILDKAIHLLEYERRIRNDKEQRTFQDKNRDE